MEPELEVSEPAILPPVQDTSITLLLETGMDAMHIRILRKALELNHGNVTKAAHMLGISRKTIYNRLRGTTL